MLEIIKVAVIDSGLTDNYLCKSANIKDYTSLNLKFLGDTQYGELEISKEYTPKCEEQVSHGTLVVNTVCKYAQDIPLEFYIYDVFGESGVSSGIVLVEALKLILDSDVDLVVMSLTCSDEYAVEFERLSERLKEQNIIMVCSSSNDGSTQCPANLDFIYGVAGDRINECGKYRYNPNDVFQFWSDVQGEFVGNPENCSFFCGTSKATAVVAGRLASYMCKNGKQKTFAYLTEYHDELSDEKDNIEIGGEVNPHLFSLFCESLNIDEKICRLKLDNVIPWTQQNIKMVTGFMKCIGLEKELMELNYSEFATMRRLIETCDRRIKA